MSLSAFFQKFSLQKALAVLLVFVIFFSQTIRFEVFHIANANPDQYRDIVSIVVDSETYRRLQWPIRRYAHDIQAYLGSTRSVILVTDEKTEPAMIAAHNEKLYYEGDETFDGKSQLVGTILIGNVPIPLVSVEGQHFPSLYPYVDFDHKVFLYNERSNRYERAPSLHGEAEAVEIWHGVINPALGVDSMDGYYEKLERFFDKTHDFYHKKRAFEVTDEDEPPRVFYYDGFAEERGVTQRSAFQYGLWIRNLETLAYQRFSKYLLHDINEALKQFDHADNASFRELIDSLNVPGINAEMIAGGSSFSGEWIRQTPDIHTAPAILNMVKTFDKIVNKKILGEELAEVRNAGRYNSAERVRADLVPVRAAITDEIARSIILKANDALEESFEEFLRSESLARKIPILDSANAHYGNSTSVPYKNYFFGREGKNVQNASQCTIARGQPGDVQEFGRSILVEANNAFDVKNAERDMRVLEEDKPYCFEAGGPHIGTFWWGNTIIRMAHASQNAWVNPLAIMPAPKWEGFVRDIESLGGMAETDRLAEPSLAHCINYDYQNTVMQPFSWRERDDRGERVRTLVRYYPSDTQGDRFRCRSEVRVFGANEPVSSLQYAKIFTGGAPDPMYLGTGRRSREPIPIRPEEFMKEVDRYSGQVDCLVGTLTLDGTVIRSVNRVCQYSYRPSGENSSTSSFNHTNYRSLNYHTIEGILRHVSPTQEEIKAAEENGVTPSLPINTTRYIEFVTKKGNIARIDYPNFFRAPIDEGTTVQHLRDWLEAESERQWKAILEKEQATEQTAEAAEVAHKFLGARELPAKFSWNDYISQEMLTQIIRSRNWLFPDVTQKYKRGVEQFLSYSGNHSSMNANLMLPELTNKWDEAEKEKKKKRTQYEIAYLGLHPVVPTSDDGDEVDAIQSASRQHRSVLAAGNIGAWFGHGLPGLWDDQSEESGTNSQGWKRPETTEHCGDPEWVNIFEYPGAIRCWMSTLGIGVMAGQCGANTIGGDASRHFPIGKDYSNFSGGIGSDAKLDSFIKNIADTVMVVPHFPRVVMSHYDSLPFVVALHEKTDTNNARVIPPSPTFAHMEILSIQDENGQAISPDRYHEVLHYTRDKISVADGMANFSLSSREKNAVIQARIALMIPISDNSSAASAWHQKSEQFHTLYSQQFRITIQETFLHAMLENEAGEAVAQIFADNNQKTYFRISEKTGQSDEMKTPSGEVKIDILDDITGEMLRENETVQNGRFELPDEIQRRAGVYRVMMRSQSMNGEMTFTVRSGQLSRLELTAASNAIRQGQSTILALVLRDGLGNTLSPDIHSVEISVENGVLLDSDENTHASMKFDIFDSMTSFRVRSENDHPVKVRVKVDDTFETEMTIAVFVDIDIRMQEPEMVAGEKGMPIHLEIEARDAAGNRVEGVDSLVSFSLPQPLGTLENGGIARIRNGRSEPLWWTPGTLATGAKVRVQVMGMGERHIPFAVKPATAAYVDHAFIEDSVNHSVALQFFFRDRFGNMAGWPEYWKVWYQYNNEERIEARVTAPNTTYQPPHSKNGVHLIEVEEREELKNEDNRSSLGMPPPGKYAVRQTQWHDRYQFAEDYNARYTVLAWGSFLREAKNILYDQNDNSQSLAVTTLLDSPQHADTLFTLFPNGGYTLGYWGDMPMEAKLYTTAEGYPELSVSNSINASTVARVRYRMKHAQMILCPSKGECVETPREPSIFGMLRTSETQGFRLENQSGKMVLSYQNRLIVGVDSSGMLEVHPSVALAPRQRDAESGLTIEVSFRGMHIADITYAYPSTTDLQLGNVETDSDRIAPIMQPHDMYDAKKFTYTAVGNGAHAYRLQWRDLRAEADENRMWPQNISDIGTLPDNFGVGWKEDNRMLLSFAAGDTVGEATKWFHTYMMVNLGDPVAHVHHNAPGTEIDGLDRTIGTHIADSRRARILDFFEKDMNADGLRDILVQYSDGYIQLILNQNGNFRSAGNIAYIPQLGDHRIQMADFQKDGFADIVALDSDGKMVLLNNAHRRFTQQKMTLTDGSDVPNYMQQMQVYDMDADGRDDLVYLTTHGELGILYGTDTVGTFEKKVLDDSLGVVLREESDIYGGALLNQFVPQKTSLWVDPIEGGELSDTMIQSEVYYQHGGAISEELPSQLLTGDVDFSHILPWVSYTGTLDDLTSERIRQITPVDDTAHIKTFIRSQFASLAQAHAVKTYKHRASGALSVGDTIQVEITLENRASEPMRWVEYLDTFPRMFARDGAALYSMEVAGKNTEKPMKPLEYGDFDLQFDVGDIPAWSSAVIRYTAQVLPMKYGDILVGDFEKGTDGHDNYGDISFKASMTCGAEMLQWLSSAAREYSARSTPSVTTAPLPNTLSGVVSGGAANPVQNMTHTEKQQAYYEMTGQKKRDLVTIEKEGKRNVSIGWNPETEANIEALADEIFNGLACGFGGGGCMSFPINWAPLAPGNDPVVFGYPVGDGLRVGEGIPIFSALTWMPVGPYCIPSVWPVSPLSAGCSGLGAWGYLGIDNPTNFVRIFVTPTLTMGMGTAVCFGATARVVGGNPWPGLSPLVQWGNCIVITKSMPVCRGDGSVYDGDISGFSGLGVLGAHRGNRDASNHDGSETSGTAGASGDHRVGRFDGSALVWNGASCQVQTSAKTAVQSEQTALEAKIIEYMRNPDTSKIAGLSVEVSKRRISSLNAWPIVRLGRGVGTEVDISISGANTIDSIDATVNVKNKRISAFPDFMMEWLTRQTEELVNTLFTPPNLTVIPPTDFGQNAKVDSTYKEFFEEIQQAYSLENMKNLQAQMGDVYANTNATPIATQQFGRGGDTTLGNAYAEWVRGGINSESFSSGLNSVEGGLAAIRTAYTFIGKMPFIKLRQERVDIHIPWILPQELDQYERRLKDYQREAEKMIADWCVSGENTQECLEARARLNSSGLVSSIRQNLQRLDEYRRFPEKLQKYINWKQKFLYDLLCNIETIEKMTTGWIKENGIRARQWAEFYVLIKAIAESWQPLLDIFADTSAQCGVCRNERYNSQTWKFKLISLIIPDIPVIRFPKFPDIILDLSDIRMGIDLSVPDFNFVISPIRLPDLPSLSLPDAPNVSLTLPVLPVLPALPNLPDLPRLPSIPRVQLPDLPPPPKIPKLGGAIKGILKIMRLISKMYCYYQNTYLIPEWQVGDVIAQRTERQGTLPIDFLDIHFPQIRLPRFRDIRISTHVNFELKSDFLTEFARNTVAPINAFSTDLAGKLPSQIGENIRIESPLPGNIHLDLSTPDRAKDSLENIQEGIENASENARDSLENAAQGLTGYQNLLKPIIAEMEADADVFLDISDFATYLRGQLVEAGFDAAIERLDHDMEVARVESGKLTQSLSRHNSERYRLMREFIREEERKTGKMQNIVDMLRAEDTAPLARVDAVGLLASEVTESSHALKELERLEGQNIQVSMSSRRDARDVMRSFHKRLARLSQSSEADATLNDANAHISTQMAAAQAGGSYTPQFRGMYVFTEKTGVQTKLFDYVAPIRPGDRVDVLDIDHDADRDYAFLLGGVLYVKKTHVNEVSIPKIIDTHVNVTEVGTEIPEVPNHFLQTLSTPSELNVMFQNTVKDETEWRMEFFDSYLEWDRVAIGSHRQSEYPKTTVDLFRSPDVTTRRDEAISVAPVARSLESGYHAEWFRLEWPKVTVLTGDIFISLSPYRMIYTGKRDVPILYRSIDQGDAERMTLKAGHVYSFQKTTEIIAKWWPLFIIGGSGGKHIYTASRDLEGLPILPGMRLTSDHAFSVRDHTHRNTIDFSPHAVYITKHMSSRTERYSVSIPYPNGFYSARLSHLSRDKTDRAGVTLLAPQRGSDTTPPVISLEEALRVPVYATTTIPLEDVITELSEYTVSLDVDTTVDADSNGIYEDDFVTSGSGVMVSDEGLVFGKFDAPGKKSMLLRVRDEFGNMTDMPLILEIFTPIPRIHHADATGMLSGALDVAVAEEPIDFFRIRNSEMPLRINTGSVLTDEGGIFSTWIAVSDEAIVARSGVQEWKIRHSGVFEALPAGFSVSVIPASATNPMRLRLVNAEKSPVYEQFLVLPRTARLVDMTASETAGNVVISADRGMQTVAARYDDPVLPGGMYVVNAEYHPLVMIARDGNIYTPDPLVRLEYSEKNGYILISAYREGHRIATVHYTLDFFFTKK